MGVTIFSKNDIKIKVSFGYSIFGEIRKIIAKSYNYELGKVYADSLSFDKDKAQEADKRFASLYEIANNETKRLMKFLCTPDVKGSATPKMCQTILKYKDCFFNNEFDDKQKNRWFEPFFKVVEDGCFKGIRWV